MCNWARNKGFPAVVLIFALLFTAVTGAQFVNQIRANPYYEEGSTDAPVISLNSPINKTYNGPVLLNFTVTKSEFWLTSLQEFNSASYYVDGVFYGSVNVNSDLSSPFDYFVYLKNLSDGSHILLIRVLFTGWIRNKISGEIFKPINSSSLAVHFTLDTTPPSVSFPSMEETCETSEFPLNFTVNEPVSKISYVLDGQENVTIAGSTTLTGLSNGLHNVTVYAWDVADNVGSSETVTFIVAKPEPPAPFPTAPVAAASVATVIVVGVGLLVYFKRRNH